ncbi:MULTISPECIES: phenylacetate--CoA ligase PaaK [unclassified Oceanobacter]|uniref:phenylacetate--CoA ligase PaaK n=1 Tax=unclassified Oceanobacter TaxID=2620260 RepID=UPI00273671E3|nr:MULTISPECIES: phenylacetate--CoA ligase PaaK [unclassified Oceanobacter]MDP2549301.1 phenylacetate--CoA ligase PaaK [Oceanobacter sp. 4_MG-2023]MDP2609075.1 phenylacetate--CoA ligase PaaK [Oceanobacter sp. 1_MG-2023]MDP2612397.1 phenylacetate--CoA ligase PaaK [Oceanobacter sp. 2_MG-2023]
MNIRDQFKQDQLDPMETASIDELRAHQLQRLKWSIGHAYHNVPLYRQRFDAAGIHPEDIQSLDDLAKLPFTTKADLRDNYPYGMFATSMDDIVRLHASSGTTGKPTVVGYTQNDIDTWANIVARSIRAAGGHRGDKVHISYGYGLFTGGLGAHYGAERLGCSVIPMSGGQTEKQVRLIRDFQPDIIMVTPSYMLNIADEMERQGITPDDLSLRLGIFGAEPWTDELRRSVEQRLGIQALDIYGLSEIMGPGVAMECAETKDGPTVWEDHFYPEIINPATGAVLADGEMGELVFTTLSKEALPMIRYRTRDLTRLLPGSARRMRRIDKITGRSDDMMIIRGVNVFPTQIEEEVVKVPQFSETYAIHLYRKGNMDSMEVHVELRPEFHYLDEAQTQRLVQELKHHVKSSVGISVAVDVRGIGTIARSEGKAQRVFDKRRQG